MQDQERRASESNRTKLETIVEICGNGIELQPFEAEASDVSGRGMHVRTAYLPPMGAPLICRFYHDGREVLVEGVVVWRVEQARGGDFGVQFTAIDKDSVEVLKALTSEGGAEVESRQSSDEELVGLGTRVRLHIDGLGAPMKAAVRDASARKLRVGSNLEFLRVGRHLELEAQDRRARQSARIDGVDVVVDPRNGVPQLMVTLRLREGDSTPQPSVIDVSRKADAAAAASSGDRSAEEQEALRFEKEVVEEGERLHLRLSEQLGVLAERAGAFFESSGGRLGSLGAHGIRGTERIAKRAMAVAERLGRPRSQKAKRPLRVTAPAPNGGFGQFTTRPPEVRRSPRPSTVSRAPAPGTRPNGNARRSSVVEQQRAPRGRRLAILSAGGGAIALVLALVLRAGIGGSEAPSERARAAVNVAAPAASQVTPGRTLGNAPPAQPRANNRIVANVPLFGEVPMAPTEPVAPAAEGVDGDVDEDGAAPARVPAPVRARPPAEVPDETWETAPVARAASNEGALAVRGSTNADPSSVAPWGRGKLHLPTVYELGLSAPGAGLEGTVEANGFSVFVPDRKASTDTLAITRRDPRIVRVVTENTKDGARIRFRFRDAVPAYKVRLRGETIQFLISAPE